MKASPIYVEIDINSSVDEVWRHTQDPSLHEQWDLRFTSIQYNEKSTPDSPQTFTYTTRIMPGIEVSGWGESKGTHEKKSGIKTSSLHFGTPQLISPIKEGKGYWQYIPKQTHVTFLTQYDYDVRFGFIGKIFDICFRPLMGWATALSFDVLARWLETGERPNTQYTRFFSYYAIGLMLCFIWLYQGLVPKIFTQQPLEVEMLAKLTSLSLSEAKKGIIFVGLLEVIFAFLFFIKRIQKYWLQLQLILYPILTIAACIAAPNEIAAPFNVVTLNSALWVLCLAAILLQKQLPTAASCKRKRGAK